MFCWLKSATIPPPPILKSKDIEASNLLYKQWFGSGSRWIRGFSPIWIQMDSGFFASPDPDPDIINPDHDLTKKDSVESAKYEITIFSTCTYSFWTFFRGSESRFLSDPDPD